MALAKYSCGEAATYRDNSDRHFLPLAVRGGGLQCRSLVQLLH
jgi:hypothetical protein